MDGHNVAYRRAVFRSYILAALSSFVCAQIFQFSRNTTETSYCHTTMPKHFKDIKVRAPDKMQTAMALPSPNLIRVVAILRVCVDCWACIDGLSRLSYRQVCHSRCVERPPPPPLPPGGKGFVPSLVPGTRTGLQAPAGMPTLKSLQVGCKGYEQTSQPPERRCLVPRGWSSLPYMYAALGGTARPTAVHLL